MAGAGNPNMVGMTKPGMLPNAPATPVAPALPAAPVFSPQMTGPFGGMLPNVSQAMPATPPAVSPTVAQQPMPAVSPDPLNGAANLNQFFVNGNALAANTPTAPMRQPTAAERAELDLPAFQASGSQSFGGPAGNGNVPPYANPGSVPTPPPAGAPATGGGKGGGRSEPPIAAPSTSIPAAPRQPNINQTAADGINQSIAGAGSEMNYQPSNILPSGYGASQVSGQGFNAANVGSTGYGATNAGSTGYGANNVQAGQIGDADLSRYLNQYDTAVINNTLGDMDRARQMQQQSSGANATAAGAFGGSRHALRESENNRNYYDQAAKTTSALRQAGFNNAQQMGLNDLQSTLQANLANQNANNAASQFGASAANTAGLTNAAAANRANEFGASAFNQAAQQYSAQQQAANQFGAQAGNTANLANQSSFNQANQFNATQNQNAQLANQAAGLAGSQQRLAAGRQLGDLSNLGFGIGQTLTGNLAQDGAMKQGLNQLLIDAARNQYSQYQSSPYDSIGLLSQALGASPVPQTTNTSKTPGLFDYLTLGASMS